MTARLAAMTYTISEDQLAEWRKTLYAAKEKLETITCCAGDERITNAADLVLLGLVVDISVLVEAVTQDIRTFMKFSHLDDPAGGSDEMQSALEAVT